MTTPRHGGDKRGSSYDRRLRKDWLASPEAGFGGDGTVVPCVHCKTLVSGPDLEADRIVPGGSYGFAPPYPNVQPACGPCNKARSDDVTWTYQGTAIVAA
jgi:hypothetical protein